MRRLLPLSSTSSLTFFIVELRLRSCEEEAKEDRWPGIRWMLHGWMILIRVLTLFSARNKPHLGCASSSSTRRDFCFPAELLVSYMSFYGVMELWSVGMLYELSTRAPRLDWCHHLRVHVTMSRRGAEELTDPWLTFLLSPGSQIHPSSSSNCLGHIIINLEHLQPLRQTILYRIVHLDFTKQ